VGQHADQPLPRLALLLPQHRAQVRQHQELLGHALLAERAAAQLVAAGPARERAVEDAGRVADEEIGEADVGGGAGQEIVARPAEQPLGGAIGQAHAIVGVERQDRDVDLLHHAMEERGGLCRAQPLLAQRGRQRVHLAGEHGEGVGGTAARMEPYREVALAQGGHDVGERGQRLGDGGAERADCGHRRHQRGEGQSPLQLAGLRAGPEQREPEGQAGKGDQGGQDQDARLVAGARAHRP
jgi:hypothetical protein